jgi:hypothetical protein
MAQAPKPKFAVGYYNGKYPGYRQATEAEWTNPVFQAQLVQAHKDGGGWPLLEGLICKNPLRVAEGWAMIDLHHITQIGYDPNNEDSHSLSKAVDKVYSAMNLGDELSWTQKLDEQLSLGENWTVTELTTKNLADINMQTMVIRKMDNHGNMIKYKSKLYPPCLFVKNAALPGDGSRRSGTHLSKRIKSLSKRIKPLKHKPSKKSTKKR